MSEEGRLVTMKPCNDSSLEASRVRGMSSSEHGVTMIEMVLVVLLIGLLIMAGGIYGINELRRERQRSAIYEIYTQVSLARVEAARRNRNCQFTIDTTSKIVRVLDLNDPSTSTDDVEIGSTTLDTGITFGRPDGSPVVTLASISGTLYGTTFKADGSVTAGSGEVGLQSDTTYRRVAVYTGGAVSVERWTGSTWVTGT